eukprot:3630866-Rhodomonas_salina.1
MSSGGEAGAGASGAGALARGAAPARTRQTGPGQAELLLGAVGGSNWTRSGRTAALFTLRVKPHTNTFLNAVAHAGDGTLCSPT